MRVVKQFIPIIKDAGVSVITNTLEELELSTGGRIMSVPANPDTVAGFTGNVYLDEFARHKDARAIWEALFPTISSRPDLRLSVCSTPLGRAGMFYEICEAAAKAGSIWSLHRCDIHQAIANGFEHNLAELREACIDDQVFRQSYLCEFVDEAYALLPYELLVQAVEPDIGYEFRGMEPGWGDLYVGVDIGRHRDMTVITVLELIRNQFVWRGAIEMHKTPFAVQERRLYDILRDRRVRRCCIDMTGMGEQFSERATELFGGNRVEGVRFSVASKDSLGMGLRVRLDEKCLALPDHTPLIDDLHSVQKEITNAGGIRLVAPRENGSHADRFWSLALAISAAPIRQRVVDYGHRTIASEGIW